MDWPIYLRERVVVIESLTIPAPGFNVPRGMADTTQLTYTAPTATEDRRFVEDLLGFFSVLRHGWHYIAVSTLVCATLAALYLIQVKPVFKSSTRLLILQQGGRPLSNLLSGGKELIEYDNDEIPTHVMVIRSPAILGRAIQTAKVKGLSVTAVLGGLTVSRPDPGVKILELGYQAGTAEEASRVVDAVVESYRKFLEDNYQQNTTDVLALIAKVRDDLSDELKELERNYLEFHRQHPVFSIGEDGRSLLGRRLDQWDTAANEAMMRAVKLQSQLDLARKLSGEGVELGTIGSTIRFLGDEKEQSLLAGLTEDAPDGSFEQVETELAAVERQRRTTQRLLDHLLTEQALSSAAKPVSESEVVAAFYSDPEATQLNEQLNTARGRRDAMLRVIRNPGDPSLTQVQRRVKVLQAALNQLWQRRRQAIVEILSRSSDSEIEATVRREEANLIVLKSRESVLREELATFQGERDRTSGHEPTELASARMATATATATPGLPPPGPPVLEAARPDTPQNGITTDPRGGAKPRLRDRVRIQVLIDAIERGLKANETMRSEMTRRFKEELAAGKEGEIERIEEEALRANLDRHRTLFNSVVDQLKQTQLVSDHTMITAQTINPTTAVAIRAQGMFVLLAALVAGCSLGVGVAYLVDLFDARLRTLQALRKALDFSVLGLIPQLPRMKVPSAGGIGLISHALPRSLVAEAYRSIRTNLESHRRNRQVQVLLITSPLSGDGKSTTASNLAISLAHAGRKVLLVDADLRRPSLHLIHDRDRFRGLVHVLKNLLPCQDVTQRTAVENLDLLAAGPAVPNPAELLGSPRFHEFLVEVRQTYDLIIIDSSPLLAVTDPLVIAEVADAIILVARAMNIQRPEAERTSELLKTIGTPVLGIVVNGFTPDQNGYSQRHGYGYGYGPGYGEGADEADPQEEDAVEEKHRSSDPRPALEASTSSTSGTAVNGTHRHHPSK